MASCKFLNTIHPTHTCNADRCESVAECSAKTVLYRNSQGPDRTAVNYTESPRS